MLFINKYIFCWGLILWNRTIKSKQKHQITNLTDSREYLQSKSKNRFGAVSDEKIGSRVLFTSNIMKVKNISI